MSAASVFVKDSVLLRDFQFNAFVGTSNNQKQCLKLDADLFTNFSKAGDTDDLKHSINYAVVSRDIKQLEESDDLKVHSNLSSLSDHLFNNVLFKTPCLGARLAITSKHNSYDFRIEKTKYKNSSNSNDNKLDKLYIKNLSLDVIIGIFTFERLQRQPVVLNIEADIDFSQGLVYGELGDDILQYVSNTNFKTVEALVTNVSKLVYTLVPNCKDCKVQVLKMNIIEYTNVGVQCQRTADELKDLKLAKFNKADITTDNFHLPTFNNETEVKSGKHIVYLAFGSNLGHQLNNINQAIKELDQHPKIKVLQTSSLYKSKPMYYLDQEDFINGCLKIETDLAPNDLLKYLKEIEYNSLKRIKHFDNGPRSIDLDILLYDSLIYNEPNLNIPHIRMLERNFVLYPLCDLISPDFVHPVTAEPIYNHLKELKPMDNNVQESIDLINLIPFSNNDEFKYIEFDLLHNKSKTQLMSILNITPDSFSDGHENNLNLEVILKRVEEMKGENVDIVDIGGCSTRPGSVQPSIDVELNRVLPVVKALKAKYGTDILISVDTYNSKVAEEALKLGADIINDISAGQFDEHMYEVIAKFGVPYIINHTRGNISTMNSLCKYEETEVDNIKIFNKDEVIVKEIGKEMSALIEKMYSFGIKRWQLILDPGLGFAKKLQENLNIIRNLPNFKRYKQQNILTDTFVSFANIPVLLGPSRKKFIGTITGKETAIERLNGTSASITAGIGFGADIVRVHDYKEMKDVCLMGDAIYKGITK